MAKKPTDRATRYALDVTASKIIAGSHVRDACRRHLDDLQHGAGRGLHWDVKAAQEAIAFFEEVLCLNGGDFEGKKFILLPWQCFIVGSLFGWKKGSYRRFRVAYIETAKGSGKSPLCAGIGMKGLVADQEQRAEIYCAATHKDQAKVLFNDALAMYDQSPLLRDKLLPSGTGQNRWNLAYPAKSSFMRVISSENKGKSGPRPHMGLLDEIHEHPNGDVIEMIRAGFKFRKQPLNVMITNSGHDKTSVCWEYHEMGAKIAAQTLENDEFFAFICALDEEDMKDDRFLTDESCWVKANPSLDAPSPLPGFDYIRGQVREAQGMPSKEAVVKRLNFCVWTESSSPWISYDVWKQCEGEPVDKSLLIGRRCWGGLDLSSTQDLTALALMFEPIEDDPVWRLVVKFWLPGDGLKQKADHDRVPYLAWRDAGYLKTQPGRAIDKLAILIEIAGYSEKYDLQCVAYDRWRIEDLMMLASREGIDMSVYNPQQPGPGIQMVPFGQGFKEMSPALDKFETMLLNADIRHDGNPVLTWCAANAVTTQDPAGNKKVAKDKATGRVDGIVAAIQATGVSSSEGPQESIYDQRAAAGQDILRTI